MAYYGGISSTNFTVSASATNYSAGANNPITVSVSPGQTVTVNFALVPGTGSATINGTVTDASTGLPIQGATVSVTPQGGSTSTTLTDVNGNYSFNVTASYP